MAAKSARRKKVLTEAPDNGRVRVSVTRGDTEKAKRLLGDLSESASVTQKYRAFRRAGLGRLSAFHNALYLRASEMAEQTRKTVYPDAPRNIPEHPKGWYRAKSKANFYDFLLRFLTVTPKILCYLPQKIAGAVRRVSRSLENSLSAYSAVRGFFEKHGHIVMLLLLSGVVFGFIAYHTSLPLSYSVVID